MWFSDPAVVREGKLLEGKLVKTYVVFHLPGFSSACGSRGRTHVPGASGGQVLPRCRHKGMHSANNGQTVFYTCTNYSFQEKESTNLPQKAKHIGSQMLYHLLAAVLDLVIMRTIIVSRVFLPLTCMTH